MSAFVEPCGAELVLRYKKQYNIPDEAEITEKMILRHWELEKSLTRRLLASTPENRWEVFGYCYSTLFCELEWLNRLVEKKNVMPPEQAYKKWVDIIGPSPQRIFEIGSGTGRMIDYLSTLGYECCATEITRERGEKHVSESKNITWRTTDGVHLNRFEQINHYDIVLSEDVVEHLHPNDIVEHFLGVFRILKPGGRYIFHTPHKFFGLWDISRVFGKLEPMGMHLKEYMVYELVQALRTAGFKHISFASPVFSKRYRNFLPFISNELSWICVLERILVPLPRRLRSKLCQYRQVFPIRDIFLIARKEKVVTAID